MCSYGQWEIIQMLKQKVLHIASSKGNVELCKLLVNNEQCNPNLQDASGNAPLHIAAKWGYVEPVQAIIGHPQCNLNIQNCDNEIPLQIALRLKHTRIVEILLKDKPSVLHMAVELNCGLLWIYGVQSQCSRCFWKHTTPCRHNEGKHWASSGIVSPTVTFPTSTTVIIKPH